MNIAVILALVALLLVVVGSSLRGPKKERVATPEAVPEPPPVYYASGKPQPVEEIMTEFGVKRVPVGVRLAGSTQEWG